MKGMKGNVGNLTWYLPTQKELGGNVYFKSPESRRTIIKLLSNVGICGVMEPNYGHNGLCINNTNADMVPELDPWTSDFIKFDGILTTREFLKKENLGLFGRSSDALALGLISKDIVGLYNISIDSLNNGILLTLPLIGGDFKAVLGPCISTWQCYVEDKDSISNYKYLHYLDNVNKIGERYFIDIRAIIKNQLSIYNIEIVYTDNRCTYSTMELGSQKREREKRRDNVLLIY